MGTPSTSQEPFRAAEVGPRIENALQAYGKTRNDLGETGLNARRLNAILELQEGPVYLFEVERIAAKLEPKNVQARQRLIDEVLGIGSEGDAGASRLPLRPPSSGDRANGRKMRPSTLDGLAEASPILKRPSPGSGQNVLEERAEGIGGIAAASPEHGEGGILVVGDERTVVLEMPSTSGLDSKRAIADEGCEGEGSAIEAAAAAQDEPSASDATVVSTSQPDASDSSSPVSGARNASQVHVHGLPPANSTKEGGDTAADVLESAEEEDGEIGSGSRLLPASVRGIICANLEGLQHACGVTQQRLVGFVRGKQVSRQNAHEAFRVLKKGGGPIEHSTAQRWATGLDVSIEWLTTEHPDDEIEAQAGKLREQLGVEAKPKDDTPPTGKPPPLPISVRQTVFRNLKSLKTTLEVTWADMFELVCGKKTSSASAAGVRFGNFRDSPRKVRQQTISSWAKRLGVSVEWLTVEHPDDEIKAWARKLEEKLHVKPKSDKMSEAAVAQDEQGASDESAGDDPDLNPETDDAYVGIVEDRLQDRRIRWRVAERVKERRNRRALTQKELSELCGQTPAWVTGVENAKIYLTPDSLRALERELELPSGFLIAESPDDAGPVESKADSELKSDGGPEITNGLPWDGLDALLSSEVDPQILGALLVVKGWMLSLPENERDATLVWLSKR